MIYVTLDVELRDHERILTSADDLPDAQRGPARAAVLGLFAWGLMWARAKRVDGLIPLAVAASALGGNQGDTISRLCSSGLWQQEPGGYRIHKYQDKNDTRDEIERRIEAARERKARFSARKSTPPPGTQTERVPNAFTPPHWNAKGTPNDFVPPGVGDRAGVGVKDLEGVQGEPCPIPAEVRPPVTPPPDRLSPEAYDRLAGRAMNAGWPDPRKEWPACRDHYRARGVHMADWESCLAAWLRKDGRFKQRGSSPPEAKKQPPIPNVIGMLERRGAT